MSTINRWIGMGLALSMTGCPEMAGSGFEVAAETELSSVEAALLGAESVAVDGRTSTDDSVLISTLEPGTYRVGSAGQVSIYGGFDMDPGGTPISPVELAGYEYFNPAGSDQADGLIGPAGAGINLGALIGRVCDASGTHCGPWFLMGSDHELTIDEPDSALYAAVNDLYYPDNQGSFAVSVEPTDTLQAQVAALHQILADHAAKIAVLEADNEQLRQYVSIDPSSHSVIFEGANIHVRSGSGSTSGEVNGLGNLIVGYDEEDSRTDTAKSGSHNLIVGPGNNYSSYGGLVVGRSNTIAAPCSVVTGGVGNRATGWYSAVSGGNGNEASGHSAAVFGGSGNQSSGLSGVVSGGDGNHASGQHALVAGGHGNTSSSLYTVAVGGEDNEANGQWSVIVGGRENIHWNGGPILGR